ncbi:MAG: hypothetical protein JWO81_3515, partial [Alphaproteobacteria bacterium]|nr:hypothetical protein [Alphaproteobacteria bacterium]
MKNRRLIDAFQLGFTQDEVPFAIPHLEEDIPLCVDPFLLWSSGNPEYRELHAQLVGFLAHFGSLVLGGEEVEAQQLLLTCREPHELGLGYASNSKGGSFIGPKTAAAAAELFLETPQLQAAAPRHVEELGLLVPNIAEDRISDLTVGVLREFFTRYTEQHAGSLGIPTRKFRIPEVWDSE